MSGDTPLLGALANVRRKMTRQTMRFLGDADARPPSASSSGPASRMGESTTPPPADQRPPPSSGTAQGRGQGRTATGPRHRKALQRVVARPCPPRWRRWGRGVTVCCIRVRSPDISISVRRPRPRGKLRGELRGELTNTTRLEVKGDVDSDASQSMHAASSSNLEMHDAESTCSGHLAGHGTDRADQDRIEKEPPAQIRPVESGAGEPRGSTPSRKLGVSDSNSLQSLVQRASNESLNTYVRRKACNIMHTVAKNMTWFERQDAARNTAGSRERLLRQVSRVAAYTAASRHLRHAANLYVVASVASRRERRGVARYRKLDCPPRALDMVPALPSPQYLSLSRPRPPQEDCSAKLPLKVSMPTSAAPRTAPHINDLPKDVLLRVFAMLNHRELSLHVAPVCRAWHRLARSREFWREITFDAAFHQYSAQSVCQLLRVTPGLWTLELVACRDVDLILAQVCQTCRKLRTLVLDSCTVSKTAAQRGQTPWGLQGLQAGADNKESVLKSVLEQCICLQYLIVAFTPHLYTDDFFSLLGRRCWSMQCFLVSADDADVRKFCESLSAESGCGGEGEEGGGGAEALLVSLTGSWTRTVPPPACPATTASDNCHTAHPARETAELRRRVTAVRTRNRLLRVLALRPDPHRELRLLQWRLAENHATLDYFGVEARLCLQ